MALDFPSSPSNGDIFTDAGSGTEWVYNSADKSWTMTGAGSSSPFDFRGGYDFTTANTISDLEGGDLFIHEGNDGTVGSGYTGITGDQITAGTLVLWDGDSFVMLSSSVPGYPDITDPNYQNGTLDDRYLNLAANAGAQVVKSPQQTEFKGGVSSDVDTGSGTSAFSFYASGTAPSFLKGSTYIGGTTSRNTLELWKSTLTEEQLEQLEAGTLVAPANVATPGDGEFARSWYYDQQDAETQAELDAGTLDYPEHLAAATFTDTFALGDNTNINLLSSGLGEFKGGVMVSDGDVTVTTGTILANTQASVAVQGFLNQDIGARASFTAFRASKTSAIVNVDEVIGYEASSNLTGGVNNSYGFKSNMAVNGEKNYNFYAAGSAPNYFKGDVSCAPASEIYDECTFSTPKLYVHASTQSNNGTTGIEIGSRAALPAVGATSGIISQLYSYTNAADNTTYAIGNVKTNVKVDGTGAFDSAASGVDFGTGFGGGFYTLMDARVKTLTPFSGNAADTIKLLNPGVNGFIAHELQAQVSDAVTGTQNATEAIGTLADYDGTVLETGVAEPDDLTYTEEVESEGVTTTVTRTRTWTATGTQPVYQGVDQTKLIPMLTKALQEALERIETLEAALA